LKIVARKDIDDIKWNRIVENSEIQNPLIYSWSMDATTENWCAVINDDYSFLWPIPFVVQFGIKRARQQPFSRQMDLIGDVSNLNEAINLLKKEFKQFDVRISLSKIYFEKQKFQILELNREIYFSTNAKRLIKKSDEYFQYEVSQDIIAILNLYGINSFLKINQPKANLKLIDSLMQAYLKHGKGFVLLAKNKEELVGSAFFIEDKDTIYYLIGDANDSDKKNGVIYGLMSQAIQKAIQDGKHYFDFGGSNVESVAKFYKKFGASDKEYSRIFWDNRPFWFKLLQKIKS